MIDEFVDIATKDGAMETFTCRPERHGPFPAVLILMDAPGVREELRDMARRLASVGYYAMLPNLYYRAGRDTMFGPDVHVDGSDARNRMRSIRTKKTITPVMDDVAAMMTYLDGQKDASKGPIGVHGYCMSGPYALAAAARYPDRVVAAAAFYATKPIDPEDPESPHLNLDKIKGEVHIACAEVDRQAPPEMIAELKALFKKAGTKGEIEDYPGVHHGFAFPARSVYDQPAAERHWERLFALYGRCLG